MIDKSLFGLPGVHRALALLLVSALLQAGLVIGQACALSAAIVHMWNGSAAFSQMGLLATFFACYFGRQLVLLVQQRFLDSFAYERAAELRQELLGRIFASRTRVLRDNGTAAVAASVLEGADQVETYLKLILPKMVGMVAIPLIILAVTFAYDWVSGVILLVMFPVIIFFMVMLGRTAKAKAEAQYGTYQQLSNHFIDTLRGIDTLAAFGASKRERGRIWRVSERFRQATVDTLKVATLSSAVLDICTVFGIGAVAIMLGLRLADHSMALATALPILVMAPDYFKPIRDFAGDFHASLDGKNALVHITRMIAGECGFRVKQAKEAALQAEGDTANDAGGHRASAGPAPAVASSGLATASGRDKAVSERPGDQSVLHDTPHLPPAIAPWSADSTLELHDVDFAYEPGRLALSDVTLQARGFTRIGIVGESGAGKSTLANLLGGFGTADAGTIAIDGKAVPDLGLDDWQRQVLLIPQDPYLFHASLRDNIAFYTPDASEQQIAHAVDVVGLRELVDELPDGLDTVVGEGGRGLSGGQAQRIALARVLLDPARKVLVFDEPTAHLDIETELELKERMLPLMEGHLVLFATHRLHWLANMNHVLVMDGGRIVEQGSPDELLASEGALAKLVERMSTGLPEGEVNERMSSGLPGTGSAARMSSGLPGTGSAARMGSEPSDDAGVSALPRDPHGVPETLAAPRRTFAVAASEAGGIPSDFDNNRAEITDDSFSSHAKDQVTASPISPIHPLSVILPNQAEQLGAELTQHADASPERMRDRAEATRTGENGSQPQTNAGASDDVGTARMRKESSRRWVRPYLGRYRKQLAAALVLGLATFACSALLMYTAGFLISWTADPALPTLAAAMYAIGFVQIFGLGRPIARYAERLVSHDWVFRMTSSLRVRLYGILEARAMHVRRDHRLGDFLGLVVDDIGHVQNLFLRTLFPVAIAVILAVATVAFYGIFDLRFAAAMLLFVVLAVGLLPALARKVNAERVRTRKQLRAALYAQLTDNVLGAADWVFSGRGDDYLHRHGEHMQAERALQRRLNRYERARDLVLAALFGLTAVAVTLWAGMHFASGHVGGTSNWIAAFALGLFPLFEAFGPVSSAVVQAEDHAQTLGRLGALPTEGDGDWQGDADATRTTAANADDVAGGRASTPVEGAHAGQSPSSGSATRDDALAPRVAEPPHANSPTAAAPTALSLDVEGVSFSYDGAAFPALDRISLHVPAGQKLAILGRSGAGKSTLAQVLRGDLIPQAGDVRIGGTDVRDLAGSMHECMGLVQQQTYLFNRTLRENLALARPDATDGEIWDAIRKVRMEGAVERLPQGLDTVLDEAGSEFSGGERHRLAFARVLLANVPVVLLDEPMVGLDPGIEHELLSTLFDTCAAKTLVMVTHHLQDIARFDRVIFVEDGRIALDGSPAELATTSTRFRNLLAFDRGRE